MNHERWARVAAIYDSAIECSHAERAAFLAAACGIDDALRREVESLIAQDVSGDGPIERVAADAAAARPVPATIGRYRVLRLIGEGGMGAVYEAEQDQPRRTVALKVVKWALASPALLRRFAQETEALARLQHPGIGRIYDAGAADSPWGPQPYFAMELIQGLPLLAYASQHHLAADARLELMIKICEAVEHAHQRGIIHRDLKPANILVDETGQPKVLDFGVARLANSAASQDTQAGDLIGTLAYMSPEQVLADPTRLDARSDVYSLGVVLYELLSERLPYAVDKSVSGAVGAVREREPVELGAINRAYRGDLQVIAATALEKDPARRYPSAGELAADLRRHLSNLPIHAIAPTAAYQIRKFIRRHRVLVGAAAAVFIALLGGIVVSSRQAILASRERDRAVRAELASKAINDFLQHDLLSQASAAGQAGQHSDPEPDLKVRTALDRAAARVAGKFDAQPLVEASIRHTIATAYLDLSLYSPARQQLEREVELRTKAAAPDDRDALLAMDQLAEVYAYEAKYAAAEPLYRKALDASIRAYGREDATTLVILNDLALLTSAKGDYAEAARLLSQALGVEQRLKGKEDTGTLELMGNLATQYNNMDRYAEAEALRTEQVAISVRVRGANHPETLTSINNLGVLYRKEGKYAESERQLQTALDGRRRIYGEGHHAVLTSMNSLSLLYQAEGRYADAEPLVRGVLAAARTSLGAEHVDTLRYLNNLADLCRKQGKSAEAEDLFERLLDARRRVLGPDHPNTTKVLISLGQLKLERRAYAAAEPLLREAAHARERKNPDSWERYYAEGLLGASLAGQGKTREAKPLLDAGHSGLLTHQNEIPAESRSVVATIEGWMARSSQ